VEKRLSGEVGQNAGPPFGRSDVIVAFFALDPLLSLALCCFFHSVTRDGDEA
jgi:hypothetical protein